MKKQLTLIQCLLIGLLMAACTEDAPTSPLGELAVRTRTNRPAASLIYIWPATESTYTVESALGLLQHSRAMADGLPVRADVRQERYTGVHIHHLQPGRYFVAVLLTTQPEAAYSYTTVTVVAGQRTEAVKRFSADAQPYTYEPWNQ